MIFLDSFLKLFFPDYSLRNPNESDLEFSIDISALSYGSPDESAIVEELKFLQKRDNFTLVISFGNADPISFRSGENSYTEILENLKTEASYQQNEPIQATLTINKVKESETITIYDLDTFTASIKRLTISQGFSVFSRALFKTDFLIFEVLDLKIPFHTATLFFYPVGSNNLTPDRWDRAKCMESLRASSYFKNIGDHNLTPDDFRISDSNIVNPDLLSLFNHYSTILSVIYLFDITSLELNQLEFKLNGYKSIKGEVDTERLIPRTEDYYNIYKWVYNGGNLNDKIGLARNIISLHFEKSGKLSLTGNPFQAIRSSYKVYEKQNIKQYIEIRNKITDQLIDFNNRANKIIETFASGFQKSALAIVTFYSSAIVARILGKGEFVNVFTIDVTILSIAFLAGSGIYYFVSRWEVREQRKRFVDSYNNMKIRYTDLLDLEDIDRILNKDKEFDQDIKFISSKLRMYSFLWWGIILILLLSTILLFFSYNLYQFFNLPFVKWILNNGCKC